MGDYRLYFLDPSNHVVGFNEYECSNDEEAIVRAQQFKDGRALELWSRARFVARITSNPPSAHRNDSEGVR